MRVETIGIKLDLIFDAKWLNKTTSMNSIEKAITEKVDNIKKDLETLKLFAEDYDALAARYKGESQSAGDYRIRKQAERTACQLRFPNKKETATPPTSPQKEVAENNAASNRRSQRMVRCLLMKKMQMRMLSLPQCSRLHLLLQPRHVLTCCLVPKRGNGMFGTLHA